MATQKVATYTMTTRIAAAKLAALGDVCIHWSFLEFRLEQAIWAFRGQTRKVGRMHTRRAFFMTRMRVFRAEFEKRFPAGSSARRWFETWAKTTETLSFERNFYVHGLWGYSTAKGEKRNTHAVSYFDQQDGESKPATIELLTMLRGTIARGIETLESLVQRHLGVPLP